MSIKANLRDGRTLSFDLRALAEREAWERCQADQTFQAQIRALAICHEGVMHTLPSPARFARVAYTAEVVGQAGRETGERINLQADDVMLSITIYAGPSKITRTDLRRIGHTRFVPKGRPWPQVVPER
jgi:hypothetical protein